MLIKCEKCGRFFGDDGNTLCSSCRITTRKFKSSGDPERDKFLMARDLVYDNPDISPQGIIDLMAEMGMDITIREILKYVDEGRLTLNTIREGNHCQRCGTKIGFGKYCDRCRFRIEQEGGVANNNASDTDTSGRVKMHISKK